MTKKTTKKTQGKSGDQEIKDPQRPQDGPEDNATASIADKESLPAVETRQVSSAAGYTPAQSTAEKLAAMRAKKDELELEELTYRLENERNRRSERKQQSETQQQSLADAERQQNAIKEACPHRKGGKDMGGLTRGTDTKYAVGTVTQPWGQQYVLCSRCGKQWNGPFNGKPADPGFYEAIQWPTDNEPSGTQIFLVYPAKSPVVAETTQKMGPSRYTNV
jgi:hypothetical protein